MSKRKGKTWFITLVLFICFCLNAHNSVAINNISAGNSLSGNHTIVSNGGIFELGFFQPEYTSDNYYIGIWYKNIPIQTVVWVANREEPISNPSISEIKISEEGNLVLINELKVHVWSTYITTNSTSTVAVLLDTGNLILVDGSDSSALIWQSFDHPTDTWLPGSNLTLAEGTNKTVLFTSWTSESDPAPGYHSFQIRGDFDTGAYTFDVLGGNQIVDNRLLQSVTGIQMHDEEHRTYFTYSFSSLLSRLVINNLGYVNQWIWSKPERKWLFSPETQNDQCKVQNFCGAFSICNPEQVPRCKCLPGFKPRSSRDWSSNNGSGGCVRFTPISCDANTSPEHDVFVAVPFTGFALESNATYLAFKSAKDCKSLCLSDCSCCAYAYYRDACYVWYSDIWDVQHPTNHENSMYLRVREISNKGKNIGSITGAVSGVLILLAIILTFVCRNRTSHMIAASTASDTSLVVYKYMALQKATKNFSKKLGGGSFGSVFKGELSNSTTAIAVKRLEGVRQGEKQFRSEVSTLGIIQHVNLVRLLGFCSEGTKKLLVYDYIKHGSLDHHLFHPKGSDILEWKTRFQIAIGVARGMTYLHEECRECIIHCDIKPENILLDSNFQPKVADFGMAKLLGRDFSKVLTTMRGTIGYLAPEWISGSAITPKADVYSYGMMLLEIISGTRNTQKRAGQSVSYFPVWAAGQLNKGDVLSLLDYRLEGNTDLEELTRASRVACWCIQDDEAHRPSMRQVVQILEGVLEVNIPPISSRLLNLVGDQEDVIFCLESLSSQSTQLHTTGAS